MFTLRMARWSKASPRGLGGEVVDSCGDGESGGRERARIVIVLHVTQAVDHDALGEERAP